MANEKRLDLIDRGALIEKKRKVCCGHGEYNYMVELWYIENAPTVDAVEVVHGRWEDVKETSLYVPDMKYTVTHTAETCSVCKVRIGFIGSKKI